MFRRDRAAYGDDEDDDDCDLYGGGGRRAENKRFVFIM